MKKLRLLISALLIVGGLITTLSFVYSNDTNKTHPQDDDKVYWFQISLRSDAKTKSYVVTRVGGKIMEGNYETFEKQLWQNMNRGQLPVGPFQLKEEAQEAFALYNIKDTLAASKLTVNDLRPEEVHWYFLKVEFSQRSKAYDFTRTAARVASGSPQDFVNVLTTGLGFEQLAIGPFWDYQKAEESKAIYRSKE